MFVITKNAEAKLLEAALTLKANPQGYYALCFYFSGLQESNRSEYQIKIAINILHDLFKGIDGGVFLCADQDLFLLCRDCDKPIIEKAIFQLRYLFSDDPLAYKAMDRENEKFCSVYDLEFHLHEFIDRCKKKTASTSEAAQAISTAEATLTPALAPALLSRVEAELAKIDIRHALRRQPICALVGNGALQPIFHEMYIHIAHLKRLLPFEVNLTANAGLFRYLTEILDKRMIALIRQQPRFYFRESTSLNFNVATLLSREFAELNAMIEPALRSSIVIEIAVSDVFADMIGFFTAQRFLKQQGYRLCLDGLNSYSLPQINREHLGFDLIKFHWNAETESHLYEEDYRHLTRIIAQNGKNRVILTRCDSKYAIDYGQQLGLSLFQGRHLDKVLNPNAKVEN